MNEQILRKIINQTDIYCDSLALADQNVYNSIWESTFAKLIVRECSTVIQDFVDHRIPASEYPARLKENFGVK
jgi:hypothetical protein